MINKNAQNCFGQRTQPKRVIMNPPLFPTTLPKITRTIKSLIAIIYHKLNKRINYDINTRLYSLWRRFTITADVSALVKFASTSKLF